MTSAYLPSKSEKVESGGSDITIMGKDFADAFVSVWLGAVPADAREDRMLGR